ncbi:iron-containing alcohol dehydrogenase [Amycolatopsis rhabdoformis]|uniref:Iron-containing alcohol dehydrogenase n=1 Tax=Amycolatopsis rhabdoformis TaxID=1448059 RepID=A0ABZ1HY21_9PSEU|nr:iron-containing alcohol dehydrogenase [Amycolatopsis rhabdoformis]WSE27030.1 iron-containing alcohol dehydrogenase [Amycolatopsis rhabdoformis]
MEAAADQNLVWGSGSLRKLAEVTDALGGRRVMAVASRSADPVVARLPDLLGGSYVGRWSDVPPHVPAHQANLAVGSAQETHADAVLAIGGGSAIGLGKIVSLALRLPLIAVPTTFSGAERTSRYFVTTERGTETGTSGRVLPRAVLYDPELVEGLPREVVAGSGITAVAHCLEVLCHSTSEEASASAREGLLLLWGSLAELAAGTGDLDSRREALAGAGLAGHALNELGRPGVVHQVCDLAAARHGLGYGLLHALVLPLVLRAYGEAAGPARAALAELRPGVSAEEAVAEFAVTLGLTVRVDPWRAAGAAGFGVAELRLLAAELSRGAGDRAEAEVFDRLAAGC